MQAGKDTATGIVRGAPRRQSEEGLEPGALAFAKALHILQSFPAGQQGTQGTHQDIQPAVLLRPLNPRVLSGLKMLDDRRVDGVSHTLCSSPERFFWEQHRPTVSLGATYVVAHTYGRDDGRIAPTHCALIDGKLGGRWSRCQVCRTPPAEARSARSGLAAGSRRASTAAPGGFPRSKTTPRSMTR